MGMDLAVKTDNILKIDRREVISGEFSGTYSFYEIVLSSGEYYYAVEIIDSYSKALEIIGNDSVSAYSLYEKISQMEACACTLHDIVSDNFQNMRMKY